MNSGSSPKPSRQDAGDQSRRLGSPAIYVAAAFAIGIAGAGSPQASEATAVRAIPELMLASAACVLVGAALVRAKRENWAAAAVLAGFVLAGATASLLFAFRFPPRHLSHLESWGIDLSRPVELQGHLLSDPVPTPSGLQFDIEATQIAQAAANGPPSTFSVNGKLRLRLAADAARDETISSESPTLHQGDSIEAALQLRRPRVYANPGSFDFRQRAASIEDLFWEGSIEGAGHFRKLPLAPAPGPGRFAEAARRTVRHAIDRLYPPWSPEGRDGAVLKAILLGDRSSLDSATLDHFRSTGLYHLLVIAGLHVGLIAALVLGLLRLLGLRRRWRHALLLVALLGYAFLVEQRAPTVRATLMLVAFIVAQLLDRDYTALNSVGLAALLLLLARPAWLFETGFQLSFSAALLIVGLAGPLLNLTIEPYRRALRHLDVVEQDAALPPRTAQFRLDLRMLIGFLRRRFRLLGRRPEAARRLVIWPLDVTFRLADLVLLSAVLQIGLLLPMAETFHRVTLAGVGLNALAVPLMAVLLAVAIPTVALATVAPAWAAWPAKGLAKIFAALFSIAEAPHLPAWLSYRVPSPPAVVAAGFALALLAAALTLRRSRAGFLLSSFGFAALALLVATAPFAPRLPAGALELTSLDCGGGLATLLVLPDRSTVLIGAGGAWRRGPPGFAYAQRWDPGENVVSPYLWFRGMKTLDILLVIDFHEGSLEGVRAILQDFQVRELWYGAGGPTRQTDYTPKELDPILGEARRRGVRLRTLAAGDRLRLGGAELRLVRTASSTGSPSLAVSGAVVLRVESGENTALVASRMSSAASMRLAQSGAEIRSRVFTGDRSSLDSAAGLSLLQRVLPQVVVLAGSRARGDDSAGLASRFQLPTGAGRLFQTDRDGAVTVEMRGSSLEVRTFRGDRLRLR
ncbi:MAG TPA: ComEC/Rec2 family competence protein [Terriglobia bacterium]|nr:ComEC/Rec2 family competence protein [Terriglobia bacterium]